jgi:hypothetical protein
MGRTGKKMPLPCIQQIAIIGFGEAGGIFGRGGQRRSK